MTTRPSGTSAECFSKQWNTSPFFSGEIVRQRPEQMCHTELVTRSPGPAWSQSQVHDIPSCHQAPTSLPQCMVQEQRMWGMCMDNPEDHPLQAQARWPSLGWANKAHGYAFSQEHAAIVPKRTISKNMDQFPAN